MNIALSLLNAAALVALVTFHFQGGGSETEQVNAQAQPQHLLRQAPQLVIMANSRFNEAILAKDTDEAKPLPIDRSERWVF